MEANPFWHAFADMSSVLANGALTLERGEGSYLWDDQGRRYIDATAGLWFANVGHGRARIADAAAEQMKRLASYSTFGDLSNPPAEELCLRVAEMAPVPGSKVFLTSGGSDSIDTATKMARGYWQLVGQPGRTVLIKRQHAYHGMHAAGTSLAGIPANRQGWGELVTDVLQVPWNDAAALRDSIERTGSDRVAAFFCEPVIGAGGVLPPPEGYLTSVRDICAQTGVLFIADEVITGFARCGDFFASNRFGLEPDLITCAKGITSGYLPLGAVIVAPEVWEPFWAPGAGIFRHGYTYSGHAAVSAAALANLEIMGEESLCARALELETRLLEALRPLASHPLVSEVRGGTGVLAAVQLDQGRIGAEPGLPAGVAVACRSHGILTRALSGGALQVSPPLVISDDQIEMLVSGIGSALEDLA